MSRGTKGFTIIEIMIYVAFVTVAMVIMAKFVADVTINAARSRVVKEVEQNAQITLERMAREVRNSRSLISVAANELVLRASDGSQITLRYNAGASTLERQDNLGITNLTSSEVRVTSSVFTAISSGVSMAFTVAQASTTVPGAYQHVANVGTTVFPRQLIY